MAYLTLLPRRPRSRLHYSITSIHRARQAARRFFLHVMLRPTRCATTFEIIGGGMVGILLAILLSSSGCGGGAPLPPIGIEIRQGIARDMKPGECRPSAPCRNAVYLRKGWKLLTTPATDAGLYEWTR